MGREDALTLARTSSQHNANQKVNTAQQKADGSSSSGNSIQAKMASTNGSQTAKPAPKRRHFVFADPVAFRYVSSASLDTLSDPC